MRIHALALALTSLLGSTLLATACGGDESPAGGSTSTGSGGGGTGGSSTDDASVGTGGSTSSSGGSTGAGGTAGTDSGSSGGNPGSGGNTSTDSSTGTGGDVGTGGNPGADGSTGTGGNTGGSAGAGSTDSGSTASGCDSPDLVWKTGTKTTFHAYSPDPCPDCTNQGVFAACGAKVETRDWVMTHRIVSVFPNYDSLKLHDLCLKSGSQTIVATVLDQCADNQCAGCCTSSKGSAEALIDVEFYTGEALGAPDGAIQWVDLGPTKTSGCN